MSRIIYFEISGKKYPLVATLAACMALEERHGGFPGFLQAVKREGLLCKALMFGFYTFVRQGVEYVNMFYRDIPLDEEIARNEDGSAACLTMDEMAEQIKLSKVPEMVDAMDAAYRAGQEETISAVRSADAKGARKSRSSNKLQWFVFLCRQMGIPYSEFHLLTLGEIQDLAICRAIQAGAMEETDVFSGNYIPDLK